MDNTNELAYLAVLEKRLKFFNSVIIAVYAVCLIGFIALYALNERGKLPSPYIAYIPIAVMFAMMGALATQRKFKSGLFHLPLSAKHTDIAKKYYVGKLLISDRFLVLNIIALVIVLTAVMFIVRVF